MAGHEMIVTARSEEAISRSLVVLRWQSRFAGLVVCIFGTLMATMVVGSFGTWFSLSSLPYVGGIGAMGGLILERWYWKRTMRRFTASFLKADGEYLEVRGVVNGGLAHVRIRISDLAGFQIGQKSSVFAAAAPVLRAIDSVTLVLSETNGDAIGLQFAGVIFDLHQLHRMAEYLAAKRAAQTTERANDSLPALG